MGNRGRQESEELTLHSVNLFKGDWDRLSAHLAPSRLSVSKALRTIVRNLNRKFDEAANTPVNISLEEITLEADDVPGN